MKKRDHINAEEVRKYLKKYDIEEASLFNGRASKKNRKVFDELMFEYTSVRVFDEGKRVEFIWDNGRPFQMDMPEGFNFSRFNNVDDFVEHVNEFIDHHNGAVEKARFAIEAMREFTEEEYHVYNALQKDVDAEIKRLNTIRKQRELNLADLNTDSLAIFHTYEKSLSRLGDLARERMKRDNKENEQER